MSKKVIDENGNEVIVDDGADDKTGKDDKKLSEEEVDESGVSWKNRAKEYERKYNEAIKKHSISDKKPDSVPAVNIDRIAKYRENLEKKGYNTDEINEKVEAMQISIDIAKESMGESLKNVSQPLNTIKETVNYNHRMALLNQFEGDKEFGGYVKKYKKDIETELDNIPLEHTILPETMEAVIGRVLLKKKAFMTDNTSSKKLKDDEIIVDMGDGTSKGKADGINIDELKAFASEYGFNLKTPEQQKIVIKAFKARQKVQDKEKATV